MKVRMKMRKRMSELFLLRSDEFVGIIIKGNLIKRENKKRKTKDGYTPWPNKENGQSK